MCFPLYYKKVYCQYMKFTRRAEGIKECRAIFRKSREDKRSQYLSLIHI